jgi:hypothetical protein
MENMNQQEVRLTVLARIPDLNSSSHVANEDAKSTSGLLASGRLLGQAMSCKLLAGMTLFLLVGAAIPFSIKSKNASDDFSLPSNSVAAGQPAPPVVPNELTPVANLSPLQPARPVVVVSAVPEKTAVPAKIPMSLAVKNESQPSASNAAALMSSWSPDVADAKPEAKAETPAANVVPSSVRRVEYQTDVRSADGLGSPLQK